MPTDDKIIGVALRRLSILSDEPGDVRERAATLAEKYDPEPVPEPEEGETRYPNVTVSLSDQDGNAFMIIGRVMRHLKRAGVSEAECTRFREEATSGDYDNVIVTAMRWVSVE